MSIEEGATSIQEDLQSSSDPEEVKQTIVGFLDEMLSNTDSLIDDVNAAGAPDVENGDEVHEQLLGLLDQVRAALETGRDGVEALDASDPQALQEGLQELGTAMQEAEIENPLEDTENAELEEAFNDNETCNEVEQLTS